MATLSRNVVLYVIGVALAVAGALGLADAIELHVAVSAVIFTVGLWVVITVHEWLDGPF